MFLYRPKFIDEWREIRAKGGYRLLMKEKGWKIFIVFVLFYLIRDSILYILIPYLGYTTVSSCF